MNYIVEIIMAQRVKNKNYPKHQQNNASKLNIPKT